MTPTQVKSVINNEGQTSLVFNNLETGERMAMDTVFNANNHNHIRIELNTTRIATLCRWFDIDTSEIKRQLELQFADSSVTLWFES